MNYSITCETINEETCYLWDMTEILGLLSHKLKTKKTEMHFSSTVYFTIVIIFVSFLANTQIGIQLVCKLQNRDPLIKLLNIIVSSLSVD